MTENPFAQFAAKPSAPAANPFEQFAPASPANGIPSPRRGYSLTEVPVEAVKNLPESAGKFVGGVVQAVTSPIQTLTGILDAGAGALRNALPRNVVNFIDQFDTNPEATQRAVQTANTIGGMYKDRYGSYEGIKRTFAEDPVGAAADLSTLLSGGGTAATTMGATKTGAAMSRAGAIINPMRPVAPVIETPVKLAAKGVGAIYNILDPKSAAYLTAVEGRGQEVLNALRQPSEIVPSSLPTAAQAAASAGATRFSAMGASAAKTTPTPYYERAEAQKAAQLGAVRQVGKTPADLAAAEAVRSATAKQLYGIADEALLPGRERQFEAVKVGQTAGGVPRVDPITGQPVMTPVQAGDVAQKVAGQTRQRTVRVEVGRDSFNKPVFEERVVPVSEPEVTQAVTRDTLTNTPIMKQDVSLGGQPVYKHVLSGYKYDPQLANLMERPAIQAAFDSAAIIAANRGVSMFTAEGKLTGQGAHLVKLALDDAIAPTPGTPLAKNTANAINSAKSSYLSWVEDKVPAYKTARETFAAQSKPINQMEVGQFLEGKLKPALGEETARLRVAGFAGALENAPGTIKRATGESRFQSLSEVLTPEQLKIVEDVRADLARAQLTERQAAAARGSGPDVNLMGTEVMGSVRAPNFINSVVTVANDLLQRLQGRLDKKLAIKLATEMLDPAAAAKALEKAMIRQARGEKLADPFRKTGKIASDVLRTPAAVNMLAPTTEVQNEFAR